MGDLGGVAPPRKMFVFLQCNFDIFIKFGGINEHDDDNFEIMDKNTWGLGGGALQKMFAIIGAKIRLKKKRANKQVGGQNDCQNLAGYNCNFF